MVNIYSVAFYIDKSAAKRDAKLAKFKSLNARSLLDSADFVSALLESMPYDRSLSFRLALVVNRDTLVNGLVDEMPMTVEHKVQ